MGDNSCDLCSNATQHPCRICHKPVCNFCSEQDRESSNEMHRVHVRGHPNCNTGQFFECPFCGEQVQRAYHLQNHILAYHSEQESSLSLRDFDFSGTCLQSEGASVSLSFGNVQEMTNELFEYSDNNCNEDSEVGRATDSTEFSPIFGGNKDLYQKRIKQNLKDVSLEDDSGDDKDWSPGKGANFECNFCDYVTDSENKLQKHKKNT